MVRWLDVHIVNCSLSHTSIVTTAKRWDSPNAHLGKIKMWHIRTTGYYSALKRNGIPIHATTLLNLKNTTLSERSQTQKVTHCPVPLEEILRIGKSTGTENRWVLAEGSGKEKGTDCLRALCFRAVGMFGNWIEAVLGQHCNYTKWQKVAWK